MLYLCVFPCRVCAHDFVEGEIGTEFWWRRKRKRERDRHVTLPQKAWKAMPTGITRTV